MSAAATGTAAMQPMTREDYRQTLLPFLAAKAGFLFLAAAAAAWGAMRQEVGLWHASASPWLDVWVRWDSGYYLEIAAHGYSYQPGQYASVAFYPLYPLLTRWLAAGNQSPAILTLAGVLIATAATAVAFLLLYRLAALDNDKDTSRRTLWLLACFPTAFFLGTVYTEGLFLCLSLAAFLCARRGRWWAAGICGGLSAATRSIGVLIILPLAWEWLQAHRRGQQDATIAELMSLALIPAGLLSYLLYLWQAFGDPFAVFKAAAAWGRAAPQADLAARIGGLFQGAITENFLPTLMDALFALAGCILLVLMLRRMRFSYLLYAAYAVAVPLATLQVVSMPRYILVAFPIFIFLGQTLKQVRTFHTVLIAGVLLQAFCIIRWSLWYWVA